MIELKEIIYILFGWGLGILGPGIIDYIKNHNKKFSLKESIVKELKDIQIRLTWIPYMVSRKYGEIDINLINWLRSQRCFDELGIEIQDFLKKPDEDLEQEIININQYNTSTHPSFDFKEIRTFVIDSNLIHFDLLDDELQTELLECKFFINVLNQEINKVNDFFLMTFNSNISTENHEIIQGNIDNKNRTIAQHAMQIVDIINKILKRLKDVSSLK